MQSHPSQAEAKLGSESESRRKPEPSTPIPFSRRGSPQLRLGFPTRSDIESWKTPPSLSPSQTLGSSLSYRLANSPSPAPSGSPSWNNSPRSSPSPTRADAPSWIQSPMSTPATTPPPFSEDVLSRFKSFLNKYNEPDDKSELYKAYIVMLQVLGRTELTVDFNHLVKWDRNLARDICNGQRSDERLSNLINTFFGENGFATEEAKINFVNMPTRITKGVTAFIALGMLLMRVQLFGKVDVLVPTFRCSQACDATISTLFDRIASGMSWCGNLTMEDVDFIEKEGKIEVAITKEPTIHANAHVEDKVLDVHSIWAIIEPIVTKGGKMPPYFKELKNDLKSATADLLSEDWFSEYFRYHPSIMPSMGRRNFEIGVYQTLDTWHLHWFSDYKNYFSGTPLHDDWRLLVWSNEHLEKNFKHGKDIFEGKAQNEEFVRDGSEPKVLSHPETVADSKKQSQKVALGEQKSDNPSHTIAVEEHKKSVAEEQNVVIEEEEKKSVAEEQMVVVEEEQKNSKNQSQTIGEEEQKKRAETKSEKQSRHETFAVAMKQQKRAETVAGDKFMESEQKKRAETVAGDKFMESKEQSHLETIAAMEQKKAETVDVDEDKLKESEKQNHTEGMESKKLSHDEIVAAEISRHENTRWGFLKFRRHVNIHPRSMGMLLDLDESEIYLARIGSEFVPHLLKTLLHMGKMNERFATVWSSYKTSKLDPRRLHPHVVKTWTNTI